MIYVAHQSQQIQLGGKGGLYGGLIITYVNPVLGQQKTKYYGPWLQPRCGVGI